MKTKIFKYALVLGLISVFTSCENEQIDEQDQNQEVSKYDETSLSNAFFGREASSDCHFEYEGMDGPEFWEDLCGEDWKDCAGNSQSPINIITNSVIEDDNMNNINLNYTSSETDIFNNGHTIQFNYDTGSSASLNNIDYNLLQFHFHTGSEHTINGVQYPMEMHLVHQDPITKLLAVIGIFFKEGRTNRELNRFMNNLPKLEDDQYISSKKYHIKDMLPSDLEFYTYGGSLTTPACSEIVTWYVVKKTVEASHQQLERFAGIMHENFRPIQALNGRVVSTND